MSRILIYPYKMASNSSKALARELGGRRIKLEGSRWRARSNDILINWGNTNSRYLESLIPEDRYPIALNMPYAVKLAANKRSAFHYLEVGDVNTVPFTTDQEEASGWLQEGHTVVVRHRLKGSGGEGAEVVSEGPLPAAPLYTKYIKKTAEYRIHVMCGAVFDSQQKKKRIEEEEANFQIRNHENGWVFCRQGVAPPQCVFEEARKAVSALRLDFGAVDVIYNRHYGAFVLEVNTAPGLEGTTLENYVESFKTLRDVIKRWWELEY